MSVMDIAGYEVDEAALAAICDRFGVAQLEVFGSASRGEAAPMSDVDVLYTLLPGARLGWNIESLSDELSALFGRPVDLVSRTAVHALLRNTVLGEAKPLYAA